MAWVEQRGTTFRVRYRLPNGTVGTDSTHRAYAAAALRGKQIDIDQEQGTYADPGLGRITLAERVSIWRTGHDAGAAKWAAYDSHLRNHILPWFGDTALNKITRQGVKVFLKHLKTRLAASSVASVMSLLGTLLREAVADQRIGSNPCQG